MIFADADLRAAAAAAPYAVFDNAGQDCCARSRILVERSAYDEFLGLLEPAVAGMRRARPGRPRQRDGAADLAPQQRGVVRGTSTTRRRRVHRLRRPTAPGSGCRRPSCSPARPTDRIWREEVFGPVVAVMPFDDEARRRRAANDTEYGLSGSIFTARRRHVRSGWPAAIAGREPLGELALGGPVLDAVRWLQAVGPRAGSSARTRRTRSPRRRTSSSPTEARPPPHPPPEEHRHGRTSRRQGRRRSPAGCSGIGLATVRRSAAATLARSQEASSVSPGTLQRDLASGFVSTPFGVPTKPGCLANRLEWQHNFKSRRCSCSARDINSANSRARTIPGSSIVSGAPCRIRAGTVQPVGSRLRDRRYSARQLQRVRDATTYRLTGGVCQGNRHQTACAATPPDFGRPA